MALRTSKGVVQVLHNTKSKLRASAAVVQVLHAPPTFSSSITFTYNLGFNSDIVFDYEIEGVVAFTSDIVFDYEIEAQDAINSDVVFDYQMVYELDFVVDYRILEQYESEIVFDYEMIETIPSRTTQLVISPLALEVHPTRTTQIVLHVVALPEQETLTTQIVLQPIVKLRPVPDPFETINTTVGEGLVPEVPFIEKWIYNTVINIGDNGRERRQALTKNPRIGLEFSLYLTEAVDRYEVFNMLYKYQAEEITYPQYQYSARVAPANKGDTRLYFNLALTDVREGEQLAIYEHHTGQTWFTSAIADIETDGVTLEEGLPRDIPDGASVCAAIVCRFPGPMAMNFDTVSGEITLKLESTQDRDFMRTPSTSLLPTFQNLPVLEKRPLAGISDTLSQNVAWLDDGIGIPRGKAKWQGALSSGKRSFRFDRYTGIEFWRQFINYCNGRQKTFLLPTFSDDLPLVEQPAPGASVLITKNRNADEYMRVSSYRFLRIETANGVIYRIASVRNIIYDENGDAESMMFRLNSPLGTNPGDNEIRTISFMFTVRLDSDTIVITHDEHDSTIELQYKAVIV